MRLLNSLTFYRYVQLLFCLNTLLRVSFVVVQFIDHIDSLGNIPMPYSLYKSLSPSIELHHRNLLESKSKDRFLKVESIVNTLSAKNNTGNLNTAKDSKSNWVSVFLINPSVWPVTNIGRLSVDSGRRSVWIIVL